MVELSYPIILDSRIYLVALPNSSFSVLSDYGSVDPCVPSLSYWASGATKVNIELLSGICGMSQGKMETIISSA